MRTPTSQYLSGDTDDLPGYAVFAGADLANLHRAGACAPFAPQRPGPAAPTFASPTRHGVPQHTVHQERYNPLKVGHQSQEASAKVRQDFGVISVTWPG